MREIDPGHVYELDNLKGEGTTTLRFYRDPAIHGFAQDGPSTQEVMRAVIARVRQLDREKPHPVNTEIIRRAREIIALFEVRALMMKVEKNNLPLSIEEYPVGRDGHLILKED
jgi:hypothetical protein